MTVIQEVVARKSEFIRDAQYQLRGNKERTTEQRERAKVALIRAGECDWLITRLRQESGVK